MTVVPSSGDVMFLGKSNDGDMCAIYAYVGEKKRWMVKSLKELCTHTSGVHLLSLEVKGREHLAVSCWECGNIRILELYPQVGYSSKDSLKVLSHWRYNPGYMIHGEVDSMFVHMVYSNKVLELGYDTFTRLNETTIPEISPRCHTLCYVPKPSRTLVAYSPSQNVITSVSVLRNKTVWKVNCGTDEFLYPPKYILYSKEREVLLVYDGSTGFLLLDPQTATPIMKASLPQMGTILELRIWKDQLIVVKELKSKPTEIVRNLSFLSLSYIFALKENLPWSLFYGQLDFTPGLERRSWRSPGRFHGRRRSGPNQ